MICTVLFISELDDIGLSTWIWSASLVVCMPWRGVHSGGELASSWVQAVISIVECITMVKAARGHYSIWPTYRCVTSDSSNVDFLLT